MMRNIRREMPKMKIAFSTIACPDYAPEQVRAAALQHGYDGVELHFLQGRQVDAGLLDERLEELKTLFRDEVPICSINSGGRFAMIDRDERLAAEKGVVRCLELASELGCPRVKTFGGKIPSDVPLEAVFDYMAEHLARIAGRGQELGVVVMVETHDEFAPSGYLEALLDRVPSPHFGALWDLMHPFRVGESPEQVDATIGARVSHVQVKDCLRTGPGTTMSAYVSVLLGKGELAGYTQTALRLLARRGYDGWVSVDWPKAIYPNIEGPEIALPHFAPVLRRYIAEAERLEHPGTPPV
jgi:sugar phosphate isomerase/epimerase